MPKVNMKWPAWNVRVSVTLVGQVQLHSFAWRAVKAATEEAAIRQGLAWTRATLKANRTPGRSKIDQCTVDVSRWTGRPASPAEGCRDNDGE